jgi:hypothetical protein
VHRSTHCCSSSKSPRAWATRVSRSVICWLMLPIIALLWRAASMSSTMATGTCVAGSAMRAVCAVNSSKVEVRFWRRSLSSHSSPPMAKTSSCIWPFKHCRSAILVVRVFSHSPSHGGSSSLRTFDNLLLLLVIYSSSTAFN